MSDTRYTFLDLATVNAPFFEQMRRAIDRVLVGGRYIGGSEVEAFEQNLAAMCGAKYAVGTSNGLDALRLILRAYIELGVMKPGDEVIVPANTFIASILAISDSGLVPVFAEPSATTMNLDTDILDRYLTDRTRAVMPVHLYGRVCFDQRLVDFARVHDLKIIEDNAQAIGAVSQIEGLSGSRVTGALGDAAAFSFYPTKNIGALGDAGAVTTSDEVLARTVRALANYGSDRQYHNIYRGLNCRLDPIQAAVLNVKLPFVDNENHVRRLNAEVYEHEIDNQAVTKPLYIADGSMVWHQYVVRVANRDKFRAYLADHGVETGVHYPVATFDQPAYRDARHADCPVARRLAAEVVSLPITRCTSPADAEEIAQIINAYNPE